jgi:hypothetical protein
MGGPKSIVEFVTTSFLSPFGVLILISAILAFFIAVSVISRGNGPLAGVALILAVLMPAMLGVLGMLTGWVNALLVMSTSDTQMKAADFAAGLAGSVLQMSVALWLSMPTLLVCIVGAWMRSLRHDRVTAAPLK